MLSSLILQTDCEATGKKMSDIIPRCSAVYLTGMYGAMGGRGLTPLYPIAQKA